MESWERDTAVGTLERTETAAAVLRGKLHLLGLPRRADALEADLAALRSLVAKGGAGLAEEAVREASREVGRDREVALAVLGGLTRKVVALQLARGRGGR